MRAALNRAKHPSRFVSLGALALVLALPLTGCGDYDPETRAATGGSGGQTTTTGQLNTAGQTAMAGAAGSTGQTTTGGAAGSAGQTGMASSSPAAGGAGGSAGSGTINVAPVEASCQAVQPCGGDVVGTWIAAGSCLPVSGVADMAGFGLGCTAAPVTGALEVTGTWTAKDDGTFTDETITSGDSQLELPPECLSISGTVTSCDRLGPALQVLGYASVECTDAASGGCTCSATIDQAGGLAMVALAPPSSGTYTSANNVVTTSSTESDNAYAYCVSGNTLVMTPQTSGQTGTLTGTIVFVKP